MAVWRFGLKDEIRLQPEGTRVDRYAPHRGRQLAQPGRFAPQIRPLGSAICSRFAPQIRPLGSAICKLISLNKKYDPIEIDEDKGFKIFGKVVG